MAKLNQFLIYDELPFWSAPFGMTLLDTVKYKSCMQVADIGSGGGFPMLELAERLGPGSLVTGNNGLNNVADIQKVVQECNRICKPGAQLVFTMNLPHTMIEFYDELRIVLNESGFTEYVSGVEEHIDKKRKPVEFWKELFLNTWFTIQSIQLDGFRYRFASSEAFFRHYFFRTAFRPSWKEILPPHSIDRIFRETGRRLEEIVSREGSLGMSVPFACFDLRKPPC
jgi:hypothetical protein